ncbi:glycosyltransferase [Flavobacterium sp. LHD-80]|uniref:glycosyltransferase n=1 Tax=Flavobacterium sp. LHD-80 TaxID=3071411 RepID=UPI0027E119A1|nr:glycosyltransferase [Flavobacterium sp. LHD-80]MDQ6472077.1 glycosyltransferase [Flavobacterium sp. LHD-80]
MRKLRVGIWVNEDYQPEKGGGFGYYSQLINAIYDYAFADAEIIFISKKFSSLWDKKDKSYEIQTLDFIPPVLPLRNRILKKVADKFRLQTITVDYSKEKERINELIKDEMYKVVDLIYYPIPGCLIDNFPYIYTLWDIGHLSMYAFPEVSMNKVYESRKQHHDIFLQKALMVFSESEHGKQEAIKYLNLNEKRIKVVPIFPSEIINEKIIASKPDKLSNDLFFIHYPAQFWSHKNHYNLLLAFKIVLSNFPNLKLIFSGSDKGNKDYILKLIEELKLSNEVLDLGFVKIEELKWIYINSQGLVMPTFLGPTNMPLLEAAELGCFVACSNLEGHKEQLVDYAYYFDPLKPKEMAEMIIKMIEDKQNGESRLYNSKFNIKNALNQIDSAFSEIKSVRFCWGTNDKIF